MQGTAPSAASGGSAAVALDSVSAFQQLVTVQVTKVVQIANTINSDGLILPDAYRNEVLLFSPCVFSDPCSVILRLCL